jgi:hypothetical protein
VAILKEALQRQQLDGRDAEPPEVVDDGRVGEAGESAAQRLGHARMAHRQAAHVRLADDGVVPLVPRWRVVSPVECRVRDLALRHAASTVASAERQVGGRPADAIAEVGVAPTEFADDRLRIRIEQQLVAIEAVAARRVVRPIAAVTVKLPRRDVGEVAVPDLVGVLG